MASHHPLDSETVWPSTLFLHERPPKLIYLDLNHWISLAKAQSGHRDGKEYWDILDACLNAVSDGIAVFPFSLFIYTELSKVPNYRQRQDLREVIETVGRYSALNSLAEVITRELEAILDQIVGPRSVPVEPISYLGWGVSHAFGRATVIKVTSADGVDMTERARRTFPDGPEAFDTLLFDAELSLNRKFIEGPTPEEEPRLRASGWKPEVGVQAHEEKASEERELVRRLDELPYWRSSRIRDVIAARELTIEYSDILQECLEARGPGAADRLFAVNADVFRSIFNAMPSSNVHVTLKSSLHRDARHRWKNNDIFDLRAMALTIPYCDVVVTDNAMKSHVSRHNIAERYNTVVISQLTELLEYL